MTERVRGMIRTVEGSEVIYIRHNIRRGMVMFLIGLVLLAVASVAFFGQDHGMVVWVLAGVIALIGLGLSILGALALRERVYFRIAPEKDLVELTIHSQGVRSYRTRMSAANRVVLELAANAHRSSSDGWSVRVAGFGDKLVLLSRGDERSMKILARQLAEDLKARVEEGTEMPGRPDLPSRHDYTGRPGTTRKTNRP
jgi:hypothetical protein